jgi:hypothetical protein
MEPELARKNVRLALLLTAVIAALFAGSVVVALIYNAAS